MFDVSPQVLAPNRRRGPRPFFSDTKLIELATYLQEKDSTIEGAAEKFGCSVSCVEKTLGRIRNKNKKPDTPTQDGPK